MMIAPGRVPTPPRARGFSAMAVIMLLLLIGGALVIMSAYFTHQARRTRGTVAQSQIRQLLLAAAPAAQAQLAAAGDAPRRVFVTTPLQDAALSLSFLGQGSVQAAVSYRGMSGTQRMRYVRSASGNWQLAEAQLLITQGQ